MIPCPTPAVTPAGLLAQVRDTKDLLRSADVQQLVFAGRGLIPIRTRMN